MNKEQRAKSLGLFNEILARSESMREFSRQIREADSDICRWKQGKKKLTCRAIISICRLYNVSPHVLNPDLFPNDLKFTFIKTKGK
jgi:hypothetical protein